MQANLVFPPALASYDQKPTFNVVIVYEDFETGKNAKRTYDFLVDSLGGECEFENQMWKFDILKIPNLQEIAAKDACNADMIIISCHGGHELPAHVCTWIETWLAEGSPAIALVGLFDCDPEDSYGIRTYLGKVARQGGMELFAQPDEWPGVGITLCRASEDESARDETPMLLDGAQRDPIPARWQLKN